MIKRKKNIIAYVALTAVTAGTLSSLNPMVASASSVGNTTKIQILGTTDVQGKFMNYEYGETSSVAGGFNQISKVVKDKRAENPNTLVLDNGDTIQGNSNNLFTNTKFLKKNTNPVALSLGEIGYDSMVLGSCEFNIELNNLNTVIEQIQKGSTSVLCANMYKGDKRVYKPYTIKEVDGVKVAIIGVTTTNIMKWNGSKLKGYSFTKPDEEVRKVIDELKKGKEADLFVVSAYVGSENEYGCIDKDGESVKDIANLCPEVSVILGGHASEGLEKEVVNGVLITTPKNNGTDVIDIDLEVKKTSNGCEVVKKDVSKVTLTKDSEVDKELNKKLKKYHDTEFKDSKCTIGTLKGECLVEEDEVNGIPQSLVSVQGITTLINEVQLYNCKNTLESLKIDLSKAHLVSASPMLSITANINPGKITKAELAKLYKYDDKMCTVKISGKQLKLYLEWCAEFYNTFNKGDFMISFNKDFNICEYDMFAGISYDINISNKIGNRIENICFSDGKKLNDKDVIYLAINDYRYYSQLIGLFGEGEHELIYESNDDDICYIRDMIADYITNVKGGCIDIKVDANWQLTGIKYNLELRDKIIQLINDGILKVEIKNNIIINSLTYSAIIEQLKNLGLHKEIEELEKIKDKYSDEVIETPSDSNSTSKDENGSVSSGDKNTSDSEAASDNETNSNNGTTNNGTDSNTGTTSNSETANSGNKVNQNNSNSETTKTGDFANIGLYGLLLALSGVGAVFAVNKKRVKENIEE